MAEVFDADLDRYFREMYGENEAEDFFDKADRLYEEKRDRELENKDEDEDEE